MARLGCLGSVFIGLFIKIYLSTAYESGTLCMYQAMTFYESFGLEVAYKIIKRELGSRVYIFTNLTQVWHDQKAVQHYDQIFMLIIGRTEKMYNLFEKLEEVNFQTGFELIAEQIIDGNEPYLDWASRYIPPYSANKTTAARNMFLPDTNEAFTFRENFINKKYGTLPPNYNMFAGLDLESNSNYTLERMQKLDIKPYQDLLERIKKGERFPPDATFPGLEMEKDDNLRAMSEEEEAPIREKLRIIREQQMLEARRNLEMRQVRYYEQNAPQMYERDHPMLRYYERNDPRVFQERDIPGNYKRNAPRDPLERDMAGNFERNAPRDLYGRNMPVYYERNVARELPERGIPMDYERNDPRQYEYYQRNIPVDYEQNAPRGFYQRYRPPPLALHYDQNAPREYYRRFAITPRDYGQNAPVGFYQRDIPPNYKQNAPLGFHQRDIPVNQKQNAQGTLHERNAPRNGDRNAQNSRNEKDTRGANTARKSNENGQRSDQAKQVTAARRRSFMEVIHNFIFPDKTDNEATNANKAENGRRGRKLRKRMRAREVTEACQPYEVVNEMDEIDEMENPQPATVKHYIYVQHIDNRNIDNRQGPRNERKPARAYRASRARKNEKRAARARQTVRANARKVYGTNQGENIRANMKYNYEHPAADTCQKNEPIFNYKSINTHDNPMAVQKDNQGMNNYHAPGDHNIRPQNEQNYFGNFHPQNEAIQHINALPAVHVNQLNMRGARPTYNPNNPPVLQELHAQAIPKVEVAMKNPPIKNFERIKQSRKVKSAPRVRKSRAKVMKKSANRPRPVMARKSKILTSAPQYKVDLEGHSTLHFIDVLHYDYEPKQKMLMIQ